MTLQEIARWLKETESIVNVLLETDNQMSELRAARAISAKIENRKNLVAVENNLAILEKQYSATEDLLRQRIMVRTLGGAIELVTDVRARIERAQQLYREWRAVEATFEFAREAGRLVDAPTEEPGKFTVQQAQDLVNQARKEYEIQMMLAEKIIPSANSSIILVR